MDPADPDISFSRSGNRKDPTLRQRCCMQNPKRKSFALRPELSGRVPSGNKVLNEELRRVPAAAGQLQDTNLGG